MGSSSSIVTTAGGGGGGSARARRRARARPWRPRRARGAVSGGALALGLRRIVGLVGRLSGRRGRRPRGRRRRGGRRRQQHARRNQRMHEVALLRAARQVDFALVGQGLELLDAQALELLRRRRHALLDLPLPLDRRRRGRRARPLRLLLRRRLRRRLLLARRRPRRRGGGVDVVRLGVRLALGLEVGEARGGLARPLRRRKAGRRGVATSRPQRVAQVLRYVHRHVLRARWRLLVLVVRLLEAQLVVVVRRRRRRRVGGNLVGIAVGLHRCRRSTHDQSAVVVRARFEYSALSLPR